ncbi:hypothetical protein EKN06_01750 [Croceicoccus ponticola]|uniref:Uncharacterized protein n=1 Tax=Croceicoccus ponticola TaxID=2217664 RepID=A0A437H014_9SPHN|nr:hypothetical protein [Croceicoccus ponticola]RVQ68966.1 hypothetical protein EKN06_01750 [Croceicoccus ponticola]
MTRGGWRLAITGLFAPLLVAGCSDPPRDAQVSAPRQYILNEVTTDWRGIRKVATFDAEVLVLARKSYGGPFADAFADYAPVDIAVAWGEGARADVHSRIDINQSGRFYYWRAGPDAWQDPRVRRFGKSSANWHLIPANDDIADQIGAIRSNGVVAIRGHLVDIYAPDGGRWKTSRTRNDKGAGACEIILVSEVRALP